MAQSGVFSDGFQTTEGAKLALERHNRLQQVYDLFLDEIQGSL